MAHSSFRHHLLLMSLTSTHATLWIIAILSFGVGDLLTTVVFLSSEMNHESNPIAAIAINEIGLWVLVPWKVAVFAVFGGLYRLTPKQIRVGVPLGLCILGLLLTGWNTYISLTGVRLTL